MIGLTKHERKILRLVAEGFSNAKLAKMLSVTEQTVRFHLSNVHRKLVVSNRTAAARWAQRHGLVDDTVEGTYQNAGRVACPPGRFFPPSSAATAPRCFLYGRRLGQTSLGGC